MGAAQTHPPPLSLSLQVDTASAYGPQKKPMFALGEGGPRGREWYKRQQEMISLALKTPVERGGFLGSFSRQVEK